jgi:hypothetical protein
VPLRKEYQFKICGAAAAGADIDRSVRERILTTGFYLVSPAGNTFAITAPEGKYHPREWYSASTEKELQGDLPQNGNDSNFLARQHKPWIPARSLHKTQNT